MDSRTGKIALSGGENLVPTRARWVVLFFLFTLTVVLYIDRICIAQAAKPMEKELGFCHTEMSIIYAAFTIAYGLFEIPTGRWGDKYGSRGVLARIVLWWSVFTFLTGSVWSFSYASNITIRLPFLGWSSPLLFDSFLLLLLIRFLFGAGEAGALPNAARISSRWFGITERPRRSFLWESSPITVRPADSPVVRSGIRLSTSILECCWQGPVFGCWSTWTVQSFPRKSLTPKAIRPDRHRQSLLSRHLPCRN